MADCDGVTQADNVEKFVSAVRREDEDTLFEVLPHVDVDAFYHEETALMTAARIGYSNICRILLEHHADVNKISPNGETPLWIAASEGNLEITKLFLKTGKCSQENLQTALHGCIENNLVHSLETLLQDPNVSPREFDNNSNTALMKAIKLRRKECVRVFLRKKNWYEFMAVKVRRGKKGVIETPMRLMIRHLPGTAIEVMDQCMELSKDKEPEDEKFEARFLFTLLDDTFATYDWTDVEAMAEELESVPHMTMIVSEDSSKIKSEEGTADSQLLFKTKSQKGGDGKPKQKVRCPVSGKNKCEYCGIQNGNKPYSDDSRILKKNHPLMIACKEKAADVLCHPLCVAMINHKWDSFGAAMFYGQLMLNFIFVALLTAHVILEKESSSIVGNSTITTNDESMYHANDVISIALLAVVASLFLRELFYMYMQRWSYIRRLNMYIRTFLGASAIALVVNNGLFSHTLDRYPLAVVTVFLAWISISWTLQKCPVIGIFFVMFTRILSNTVTIILIFVPILLGFSFTFSILLDILPLFRKEFSIATVLVMLSGEVDYAGTMADGSDMSSAVKYKVTTIMLYVVFIVTMVICLLNLLVGIAVADVDTLYKQAEAKMMALKVEEVLTTEFDLSNTSRSSMRNTVRGCLKYSPNQHKVMGKNILPWFSFIKYRDSRLEAENLLKINSERPAQTFENIREEISQLRNDLSLMRAHAPRPKRKFSVVAMAAQIRPRGLAIVRKEDLSGPQKI